jgi:small nuclear ribonucleoprotein (snRNP)-like protein
MQPSPSHASSSTLVPPPPPSRAIDLADALLDFFRIHDPDKLPSAEAIAASYASRVPLLEAFLSVKYACGEAPLARARLCALSHFYDPLAALYDDTARPPLLDVAPADSLHKAAELLPVGGDADGAPLLRRGPSLSAEAAARDARAAASAAGLAMCLLDYWADAHMTGPLSLLRVLALERALVRVVVLSGDGGGPRGCLRGVLRGFDSAGSLLLTEASEEVVCARGERRTRQVGHVLLVMGNAVLSVARERRGGAGKRSPHAASGGGGAARAAADGRGGALMLGVGREAGD